MSDNVSILAASTTSMLPATRTLTTALPGDCAR